MLAWPAIALLRASLPDARVAALVPRYTESLARACPWIDEVLIDPGRHGSRSEQAALVKRVREGGYDALLTLFSTFRVGWLGWRARIPLRVAPATKAAQVFYGQRVLQRRSRSEKPEYQYNMDLAKALVRTLGFPVVLPRAPFWPLSDDERLAEREMLRDRLGLDMGETWIFVHSGSGGSANNLSLEQYAELVVRIEGPLAGLGALRKPRWILTAGPGESEALSQLVQLLHDKGIAPVPYESDRGLAAFARSLAAADLFIAGSTGPLHVAGCLDVPTVGFFPGKRSSTALRWQPANGPGRTLGISPESGMDQSDMSRVDLVHSAIRICEFWRSIGSSSDRECGVIGRSRSTE